MRIAPSHVRMNQGSAETFALFFHAEDGIRDHCVTGVQTCALPISPAAPERGEGGSRRSFRDPEHGDTAPWLQAKIFPGLKIFLGSNARLISRITPNNSSPSWSRMYSVRAMPTPCSAEREPLNCCTSAEV